MLVQYLSRIPTLGHLPRQELANLAHKVTVLSLPPGRCVVDKQGALPSYLFLVRGKLRMRAPNRVVKSRRMGALDPVYPGCSGLQTLSACQILCIDRARYEFLSQRHMGEYSMASNEVAVWLNRFLHSHMMRHLGGSAWRALVAVFSPRVYQPGATIVRYGERGTHCYVIESGHAVVHQAEQTLDHLGPGDFFGEDALVLNARRNATVTALDAVRVQAIDGATFKQHVLERLVEFVAIPAAGKRICLAHRNVCDACGFVEGQTLSTALKDIRQFSDSLDTRQTYHICGGTRSERALGALLLMQRGIVAHPMLDDRA